MKKMNVLLGITGGIAAYKIPELIRRLREKDASVQVVLTKNANKFVIAHHKDPYAPPTKI